MANELVLSVISGFRLEVDENLSLLYYWAASSSHLFPTMRDNLSVPTWPLKTGLIGCPETSVINYH
jgi:hypothetical protein